MFSNITKTYLYDFDPLTPHFFIVKLGFRGVYIIFLISAQNIDCGYSLEPPQRGPCKKLPPLSLTPLPPHNEAKVTSVCVLWKRWFVVFSTKSISRGLIIAYVGVTISYAGLNLLRRSY